MLKPLDLEKIVEFIKTSKHCELGIWTIEYKFYHGIKCLSVDVSSSSINKIKLGILFKGALEGCELNKSDKIAIMKAVDQRLGVEAAKEAAKEERKKKAKTNKLKNKFYKALR